MATMLTLASGAGSGSGGADFAHEGRWEQLIGYLSHTMGKGGHASTPREGPRGAMGKGKEMAKGAMAKGKDHLAGREKYRAACLPLAARYIASLPPHIVRAQLDKASSPLRVLADAVTRRTMSAKEGELAERLLLALGEAQPDAAYLLGQTREVLAHSLTHSLHLSLTHFLTYPLRRSRPARPRARRIAHSCFASSPNSPRSRPPSSAPTPAGYARCSYRSCTPTIQSAAVRRRRSSRRRCCACRMCGRRPPARKSAPTCAASRTSWDRSTASFATTPRSACACSSRRRSPPPPPLPMLSL